MSEVKGTQELVLKALSNGHNTRERIRRDTRLNDAQVHGALVGLALEDRVELKAGLWSVRNDK